MPTKLSDLAAVTDVLGTDEYLLARSGDSNKIEASDLATGLSALAPPPAGAMELLDEIVVGVGGAANIDFTSISGSYRHLKIFYRIKSEGAGNDVLMRLNNDSGSNYTFNLDRAIAGTASAATAGATSLDVGMVPATGDTYEGTGEITVPYYSTGTVTRSVFSLYAGANASGMHTGNTSGVWTGTAAITRITFIVGGGVDFKEGSIMSLYGIT